MREKIKKFSKSTRILFFFVYTQKGIERFNESRFKSRKVKRRATSSENRKFFVAVVKSALGVFKKMLTNGGFVKLLWAYVNLARARKTLAVGQGRRIGDGSRNVLFNSLFQALRCATNVPTIAVAHKLVNNIAVMMGR